MEHKIIKNRDNKKENMHKIYVKKGSIKMTEINLPLSELHYTVRDKTLQLKVRDWQNGFLKTDLTICSL